VALLICLLLNEPTMFAIKNEISVGVCPDVLSQRLARVKIGANNNRRPYSTNFNVSLKCFAGHAQIISGRIYRARLDPTEEMIPEAVPR
jgi:hypothetical protein